MKTLKTILLITFFFTLTSCEVMQGVSAGLGTCTYRSRVYSFSNNEWKEGMFTVKSMSDETRLKIANWVQSKNQYYANLKRFNTYYENDPYTNRQYKFYVDCI
ncbi:hypothetical protein [Polaribacter sp.]|uniref:hypothetical protein n=1 Tax=Polaribacter sp. TaxID=1920175 RepID=UPI004048DE92